MDTKYLVRQHNKWSATLEVPKHLRERAGKVRFKKSLGTDSLAEANRRKFPIIAEWQHQLALLEAEGSGTDREKAREAAEWHAALKASADRWTEDTDGREVNEREETLSYIRDEAKAIEEDHGADAARRFFNAATGKATFLKDQYPTWIGEVV